MKVQGKHQHSGISTKIEVKANRYALGPSTAFKATHREKITGGAMRPKMFFGATADEARAKAEEYDRKLKVLEKLFQASRPYWVEIANEWITSLKPE